MLDQPRRVSWKFLMLANTSSALQHLYTICLHQGHVCARLLQKLFHLAHVNFLHLQKICGTECADCELPEHRNSFGHVISKLDAKFARTERCLCINTSGAKGRRHRTVFFYLEDLNTRRLMWSGERLRRREHNYWQMAWNINWGNLLCRFMGRFSYSFEEKNCLKGKLKWTELFCLKSCKKNTDVCVNSIKISEQSKIRF
jgi:hypothetical protein